MSGLTDELRRRLDVPADLVADSLLDAILDVAIVNVEPWLAPDLDTRQAHQPNITEAVLQLAVKLWDVSNKGTTGLDPTGDWTTPAPAATPGLVRSVFGTLGPALHTGGLSV